MSSVSIIGASGFIGEYLLATLAEQRCHEIRVLARVKKEVSDNIEQISVIQGDLLAPETLDPLLAPGATVINLAYIGSNPKQSNLLAMKHLADACARKKVKRLIHCSTAVVTGRVVENWVDESTLCNPVSEYERTKLEMENILLEKSLGKFELCILRPTAVFGRGGKNLLSLAKRLNEDTFFLNYLKSCLFYHRSMNLVCVENVVAALKFLLDADCKVDREIFIISDDDSSINNYHDIEKILQQKSERPKSLKSLALPPFVLKMLLHLAGKSIINPLVKYSDKKLAALGFRKPHSLEAGLENFANYSVKHEHS
jgi:nucleoside-diphosphate-sugar epimerase